MLELLVGLLVTTGLSPVVRSFMIRHNVVDVPNHRSSHSTPVPRGGGLACLAGVLAAGAAAQASGSDVPWVAVGAGVALALLGFADDRLTLPALPRLLAQVVAGGVLGASLAGWSGLVVGCVVVVGAVNVVNFMDGINGITSLTMAVWGVVALAVGRHEQLPSLWVPGAVAAGAALGFLPWNAPRARLFLGDVGSYLFGGLAAAGIVAGWSRSPALALTVAAPLAVHAVDVAWTLLRRARRGEKLTEAHREHVYQRLVDRGLSHLTTASVVAGFALVATAFAVLLPTPWTIALLVGLGVVYAALPHIGSGAEDPPCA